MSVIIIVARCARAVISRHLIATDLIKDHMLDFIGLQETIKKDYSPIFFRRMDPFNQFCWKWIASVGRTGGILGGYRYSRFDVCDSVMNRFFIKGYLDGFENSKKWCLIIVYGDAQEEDKEDFLIELGDICKDQSLPLLIGGDFNLLRCSAD
jgi:hypothetical protein